MFRFFSANSRVASIQSRLLPSTHRRSELVQKKKPPITKMAGQSDQRMSLFSAEELEFIAEDEKVEVVPNLRMEPLNLICGDFGPFYPQIAFEVPLWLAVALKKRGKCSIRHPQWMSVEKLMKVLESESESQEMSDQLPFHYVEISRLLSDHNPEECHFQIKNLSAMEVNIVRPFIGRALQAFYKHDSPELIPDPERVLERRQQVTNTAPRRQLRR